jgi:quercetin dioxygenase-like cupin family protein
MSTSETPALRKAKTFEWEGVARRLYKEEGEAPFKAVSRHVLFSDPRMAGELRYFEIEPHGYSTLERHEHMHAVIIVRGEADVLVGDKVLRAEPHDLITIPPWTWHQFRTRGDEPMGFLCLVNAERDRPQLPTAEELAQMRGDAQVARFLEGR